MVVFLEMLCEKHLWWSLVDVCLSRFCVMVLGGCLVVCALCHGVHNEKLSSMKVAVVLLVAGIGGWTRWILIVKT